MKTIITILAVLTLASCNKEQKNGNCQCYEEHQVFDTTSGVFEWVTEYTTPAQQEDCSNAHGWVETSQANRYRKICQ